MLKRAYRVDGDASGRSPAFWIAIAGMALVGAGALTLVLPGALAPPRWGVVGPLPTNSVFAGPDRDVSCIVEPDAFLPCTTLLPTLDPQERTLGRALEMAGVDRGTSLCLQATTLGLDAPLDFFFDLAACSERLGGPR